MINKLVLISISLCLLLLIFDSVNQFMCLSFQAFRIRFKMNYMTPFEVHVVIHNCCSGVLSSLGTHRQSSSHVPCQSAHTHRFTYQNWILTDCLSRFLHMWINLFVSLERELAQVLRQQNSSSMSYKFLLRTSSKHQQDISLLVMC